MRNVAQRCLALCLQITFRSYVIKPRFSPSWDRSCVKMAASRRYSLKNKLGDRMIKQLLNSVIAKDYDLPVVSGSIIYLSAEANNLLTLVLTTNKSRYFALPRRIIVNSLTELSNRGEKWIMYKLDNDSRKK